MPRGNAADFVEDSKCFAAKRWLEVLLPDCEDKLGTSARLVQSRSESAERRAREIAPHGPSTSACDDLSRRRLVSMQAIARDEGN